MTSLDQQGRLADEKLSRLGLCLTQGGEPTFVPRDTSRPEWNVAALGEEKLLYAHRLARSLAANLYPGAVVMRSFSKQYPGEPLPRWQIGLYRSRHHTKKPVWKDLDRLCLDQDTVHKATRDQAKLFMRRLAAALKLKGTVLPAYEDLETLLRQSDDPSCQAFLPHFTARRRAFRKPSAKREDWDRWTDHLQPAGWVLPLDRSEDGWTTEPWPLPTGGEVMLIPGDSPIGLRLPLRLLPDGTIRSALTIECKDDELLVFLPPLSSLAAFWELIATLEKIATRLDLPPLRLEGYPPPREDDLEAITFMSDPGVIEVNLPPADNWPEFQRIVRGLYDAADSCGLRGFKYQLSGRLIGAGGGAHIILGGPDLDRNPFIQKPSLLASFLRFFQNHPSLSYVFTGLFTGPSSQAPRVDESAFETPSELEITLHALETMCAPGDPYMMDAMLRNLLMDWNGNTHRAEISVDKFYNQNAPNGRLGLIEFRAFEMVPTADMHLAMNLLLRALAAAFAEEPYRHPLIQWRDALHDRFALPAFLEKDLMDVGEFLARYGFQWDRTWFKPQLDFRFPVIHAWEKDQTTWTLRQAIEPWPVMGDHSGTGRTVDASTDRLELRAQGLHASTPPIVTVNDWRLPLAQGPTEDSLVGGIRYRLFDNPWGLQPQIRTHCPLRFAWVDPRSGHVLQAFEYLNWKRDDTPYDGPPRDADEAQRRVRERLVHHRQLEGSKAVWNDLPPSPASPLTLDLRRC